MSTTTMASTIVDAQLHLSLYVTAGSMSCATSTSQTMKQTMRSSPRCYCNCNFLCFCTSNCPMEQL